VRSITSREVVFNEKKRLQKCFGQILKNPDFSLNKLGNLSYVAEPVVHRNNRQLMDGGFKSHFFLNFSSQFALFTWHLKTASSTGHPQKILYLDELRRSKQILFRLFKKETACGVNSALRYNADFQNVEKNGQCQRFWPILVVPPQGLHRCPPQVLGDSQVGYLGQVRLG
jgi:hypothetical protein